jgi:hypothetical protein
MDPATSRSRCLGYIINLAAKAFILGKNTDSFKVTEDAIKDLTSRESRLGGYEEGSGR